MASTIEILLKARNETDAAFASLLANLEKSGKQAKETTSLFGTLGDGFKAGLGIDLARRSLDVLGGALKTLGSALVGAVADTVTLGSNLSNMSAKTGVSVEGLQKLGFAAKQSGIGLADVTQAIGAMQKGLVAGDKDFARLGLSVSALRAMKPEDAFVQIGTAIAGLKNPTDQAAIAMSVFGKAGATLLPMLKAGLISTMKDAEALGLVMSTRTAEAANKLGGTFGNLQAVLTGLKNNIAAVIIENASLHAFLEKGIELFASWSKEINGNKAQLGDLVSNGVILLAQSLVNMVDVGITVSDWFFKVTELARGTAVMFLNAAEALIKYSIAVGYLTGSKNLDKYDQDLNKVQASLLALGKSSQKAQEDGIAFANKLIVLQGGLKQMEAAAVKAKGALLALGKTPTGGGELGASAAATAAAEKAAAKRKELFDMVLLHEKQNMTRWLEEQAKGAVDLAGKLADIWNQSAEDYEEATEEEEDARIKAEDLKGEAIARTRDLQREANEEMIRSIADVSAAFSSLIQDLGVGEDNFLVKIADGFAAGAEAALEFAQATNNAGRAVALMHAASSAAKSKSVLGGAATGAMTGAAIGSIIPGLGTAAGAAIGALGGALAGLFGKAKAAREELKKMAEELVKLKDATIKTFGSLEAFRKQAVALGVDVSKAFSTKDPKEFQAAVDAVNKAMEEHDKRIKALSEAMTFLDKRIKGFAESVDRGGLSIDEQNKRLDRYKAKLKEAGVEEKEIARLVKERANQLDKANTVTEETQAGFDRMGRFALATFAAMVRETGNVIGAIREMGGSLDQLAELQRKFGFESSAALDRLMGIRGVILANEDLADSIEGLNGLMNALGEGGAMTAGLFQDFATDAGSLYNELIGRGVDANTAMALMQPTLQQLWEEQQRFGTVTDETTARLIEEGVTQGLIGEQMMDVNEQILEVLKLLVEAVGGTLPDAFRRMGDTARDELGRTRDAANDTADAVDSIIPPTGGGGNTGVGGRPHYDPAASASGGWFPPGRPQLSWMAEGGAGGRSGEFAIPKEMLQAMLNQAAASGASASGGGGGRVSVEIGGRPLDTYLTRRMDQRGIRSPRRKG